jgi:hypothetical protein
MLSVSPSTPTTTSWRFLFLEAVRLHTGAAQMRPCNPWRGLGSVAMLYGSSMPPCDIFAIVSEYVIATPVIPLFAHTIDELQADKLFLRA